MSNLLSKFVRVGAVGALLAAGVPTAGAFAAANAAPAPPGNGPAPGTLNPVNKSTPEFDAFRKAWDGLTNYTGTIVSHETTNDGKQAQNRTYTYKFVKPNAALITVIAGPGKGGGAAWHGGPKVKGRQGGMIAFLKITLAKNDPRAMSLRGDQIDAASFGFQLDHFATVPGALTETKTADGTLVTLVPQVPEPGGVTKETLTFSAGTHLPMKREQFVGERSVETAVYADVKLNEPNLKDSDIDV